jgi:hypothetical protein
LRRNAAVDEKPLLAMARRIATGGNRQGLMLRRSPLRVDCTAVLALGSCRITRYALRAALEQMRQVRSRSALRAPTPALALQAASGREARPFARHKRSTGPFVSLLTSSSPQKSPLPGTACREVEAVPVFDRTRTARTFTGTVHAKRSAKFRFAPQAAAGL